jgi:hypothetical protein
MLNSIFNKKNSNSYVISLYLLEDQLIDKSLIVLRDHDYANFEIM